MHIITQDRTHNISSVSGLYGFGVVDADGHPISDFFHYRGGRSLASEKDLYNRFHEIKRWNYLAGRWFYAGILYPHFGHFLTESIHRLRWYLENCSDYDGVVFLKCPQMGSFDYDPLEVTYIRDILFGYFMISPSSIRLLDEPTLADHLATGRQLSQLGFPPDSNYIGYLGRLTERYLKKENKDLDRDGPPVFFSRKNYSQAGRVLGSDAVEEVFLKNGYMSIKPEEHPLSTQLGLIEAAPIIALEAGSSIHLLELVDTSSQKVIILSRRGFDGRYWKSLYGGRRSNMHVFDVVIPMGSYLGQHPSVGTAIYHPALLADFLIKHSVNLSRGDFHDSLSRNFFLDLKRLGYELK